MINKNNVLGGVLIEFIFVFTLIFTIGIIEILILR